MLVRHPGEQREERRESLLSFFYANVIFANRRFPTFSR